MSVAKVGRPTDYNDDIAEKLCFLLSEGASLHSICKQDDMPSKQTVFTWLSKNDQFLDSYTIAREQQAELFVDECLEIADEDSRDMYQDAKSGGTAPNPVSVRRDEQRIKTRQWFASVVAPTKYGLKNQTTRAKLRAGTASEMADEILKKFADGEMSSESANDAMKVVTTKLGIEQGQELMERLEALEMKTELLR